MQSITTAHPWEVRMVHYLWSLRDIDQTLFIMYCVELTPAAHWIFAWLKKRQQYYSSLTRLQTLIIYPAWMRVKKREELLHSSLVLMLHSLNPQ